MNRRSLQLVAGAVALAVVGAVAYAAIGHQAHVPLPSHPQVEGMRSPAVDFPEGSSDADLIAFIGAHREASQSDDPIINRKITAAILALEHSGEPATVAALVSAIGFFSDAPLQDGPPSTVHDMAGALKYATTAGHWSLAELHPAYGVLCRKAGSDIIEPMLAEIGTLPSAEYAAFMARAAEILSMCEPIDKMQARLQARLDGPLSKDARANFQTTNEQLSHLKPLAAQR